MIAVRPMELPQRSQRKVAKKEGNLEGGGGGGGGGVQPNSATAPLAARNKLLAAGGS